SGERSARAGAHPDRHRGLLLAQGLGRPGYQRRAAGGARHRRSRPAGAGGRPRPGAAGLRPVRGRRRAVRRQCLAQPLDPAGRQPVPPGRLGKRQERPAAR
ncbi:hypothetical protein LTR94_036493, partial [Friedmanniomyces endolithicus]